MVMTEKLATPSWAQPGKDPRLTSEGVALIEERIRDIEQRRIPEMRPLLVEDERDERDVAAFESLLFEVEMWQRLLAETTVLAHDPEDFDGSVSLGVRALVRIPEGEIWVTPVHPAEAFLDDERVSAESPLGSALIGKKPGETVLVQAPRGTWECTVMQTDDALLVPRAHGS